MALVNDGPEIRRGAAIPEGRQGETPAEKAGRTEGRRAEVAPSRRVRRGCPRRSPGPCRAGRHSGAWGSPGFRTGSQARARARRCRDRSRIRGRGCGVVVIAAAGRARALRPAPAGVGHRLNAIRRTGRDRCRTPDRAKSKHEHRHRQKAEPRDRPGVARSAKHGGRGLGGEVARSNDRPPNVARGAPPVKERADFVAVNHSIQIEALEITNTLGSWPSATPRTDRSSRLGVRVRPRQPARSTGPATESLRRRYGR